jgi:amino acid permease
MNKQYFEAIATLVGTVIGAGVLGLPYVIAQSGVLIGLIHILILGIGVLFINLYIAEISLRTKKKHQLVGYAEKYIGKYGKLFMTLATIIGVYGALIAYLIGEGESLRALFSINATTAMLGFFILMGFLIYKGLNIIERWELTLSGLMIIIIFIIIFFGIPSINFSNLTSVNYSKFFLPYGVILFSFIGAIAIPEMKETLIKQKKKLKSAVIIGSLIPITIYAIFAIVTVGVSGLSTSQIATIGLGKVLGTHMVILGNLFAIFSMATSFLALGLGLQWMYQFDFGMKKSRAFILTMTIPLIIVLLKFTNFIQALGITGAIAGGIEGIIIVIMFHKARKLGERKPEFQVKTNKFISGILITIFIGGIIYTLFNFL